MAIGADPTRPAPTGRGDGPARSPDVPEPVPVTVVDPERFASRWRSVRFGLGPAGHLWRGGGLVTVAVDGATVAEGVPLAVDVVREQVAWYALVATVAVGLAVGTTIALITGSADVWQIVGPFLAAFAPIQTLPCVRLLLRDHAGDDRTLHLYVRASRGFRSRHRFEQVAAAVRAVAVTETGADP